MTNEEREALIAQGWTPPVAVDPDLAETYQFLGWNDEHGAILAALKHGREIERAEAKPGLVWVKHDGSKYCPAPLGVWVTTRVTTRVNGGGYVYYSTQMATDSNWRWVTHYAIITPPEDVA